MSDVENDFATIRALLQKSGSPEDWKSLLKHLKRMLSDPSFHESYLPYIESSLERWDDEVRQTNLSTPAFLMPLGRVFSFLRCSSLKKRTIRENLSPNRGVLKDYKGVHFGELLNHAPFMVQSYCKAIGKSVEFLHLQFSTPEYMSKVCVETLEWVFDRYQGSLTHIGLDCSSPPSEAFLEAMWGTLIQWAPKLTQIESLTLGVTQAHAKQGTQPKDWANDVLSCSSFDRIHTLSDCNHDAPLSSQVVASRKASKNLKRLRLHGIEQETGMGLVKEPNLRNVEVWELISPAHHGNYGWGSVFADQWAKARADMAQ